MEVGKCLEAISVKGCKAGRCQATPQGRRAGGVVSGIIEFRLCEKSETRKEPLSSPASIAWAAAGGIMAAMEGPVSG